MDDKDKKISSLKNVLQKLKTKVTKQEENLRLMKLQKLNETRKKWRNFKTFEMHTTKSITLPFKIKQTFNYNKTCLVYLGDIVTIYKRSHGLKRMKCFHKTWHCFGLGFIVILTTILPLFQATSTLQLNHTQHTTRRELLVHRHPHIKVHARGAFSPVIILHVVIITSSDDKIKRVDSIKVTFVNPFHHSELDKWISQCYRNNDLKCIVQGISKYSQLYSLRDAVIEKVISIYGQFFTFILSEENHCCLVKCENLQWGLTYFVGYWKIEGSTCSGSMKHYFIFELQPSGTSLGVDFSNTLMELCEKEHWERHTLKKFGENVGGRYFKSNDVIFCKLVRCSLIDACAQHRWADYTGVGKHT
ncbi:unnamed protein product [Timema podura]|uniref:Uncharacterized protein n=1 Tax=Timema podura TaxID=61482 RepID=A0ABN7NR90_TIMPD|nr:unnamed protein product [Timema podura]